MARGERSPHPPRLARDGGGLGRDHLARALIAFLLSAIPVLQAGCTGPPDAPGNPSEPSYAHAPEPVAAGTTEGAGMVCRLESVVDGDSLRLRCQGQPVEVRLHCIDAPEYRQRPWGRASTKHLRQMAKAAREVEMVPVTSDRFGRTVAKVYLREPSRRMLNLAQVEAGQAAVYRRYCADPRFEQAERLARAARIGIWSRPGEHQTPWVFRHR